jgi:hypothetical protein
MRLKFLFAIDVEDTCIDSLSLGMWDHEVIERCGEPCAGSVDSSVDNYLLVLHYSYPELPSDTDEVVTFILEITEFGLEHVAYQLESDPELTVHTLWGEEVLCE